MEGSKEKETMKNGCYEVAGWGSTIPEGSGNQEEEAGMCGWAVQGNKGMVDLHFNASSDIQSEGIGFTTTPAIR